MRDYLHEYRDFIENYLRKSKPIEIKSEYRDSEYICPTEYKNSSNHIDETRYNIFEVE